MKGSRPGITALAGLVVIVLIVAVAFYITIPMVSSSSTTSTTATTSPTTSSTGSTTGTSGTLTIGTKQPLIVAPGVNESLTLRFTAIGTVSGNYTLSASSLPKGVTASFQPSTINLPAQLTNAVTLTLSAASGTPAGNSTVNLQAASGSSVFSNQFSLQNVLSLVLIQGNAFLPNSVTVAAGTTVYWINLDAGGGENVAGAGGHDVTALDGSFSSGNGNLQQYNVYSHTFGTAGTFKYQSAAQPAMTGQVVVTG